MRLVFYNHYGNGDLFESREFVLDWMRRAGVTKAQYAHRRLPGIFADLPQLESIDVTPEMDMRAGWTRRENGDLWVNTWIGARNGETNPKGDYVLWPGVGCTVENLYRMHNDYLREAGLPPLPRSVVEYIPAIDYTRIYMGGVNLFVDARRGKKLILICNGLTGSGHAANFEYGEMIALLTERAERVFIFTQKPVIPSGVEGSRGTAGDAAAQNDHGVSRQARNDARKDVFFSDDLTGREPGGWDLNAISYLSRFCDVIVGRCSGAQMFTQVLPNWRDSRKTQVCFTHHRNGACFVRDPEALGLRMKVAWSPAEDAESAAEFLKGYL